MRVPIPVVILLCHCVISGVWWAGTRKHDFLTPPSENRLAVIRERAGDGMHGQDATSDVSPTPGAENIIPQTQAEVAKPSQDSPPQLADYRHQAEEDPASLVELARKLEARGKFQHLLLAWERILDSALPDEARTAMALQAIKRLRPTLAKWNMDPSKTLSITLHARTGKSTAGILTPVLEQIAGDLMEASSGILNISTQVTAGNDIPKKRGPAPIAIWIAGPSDKARTTEARVFTVGPVDTLRNDVLKIVLQIIRSQLGRSASLTVPEISNSDANSPDSMHFCVTRLGWQELGSELNKSLE